MEMEGKEWEGNEEVDGMRKGWSKGENRMEKRGCGAGYKVERGG